MRRALAVIALFSAACADTIVLGTECLTASGVCEQQKPPPGSDGLDAGSPPAEFTDGGEEPPAASLDGGGEERPPIETPPLDSGRPPRDASLLPPLDARVPPVPADAGPPGFPTFINPSFELVAGGREGAIAETIPGAQSPSETSIAPWYVCRSGTSVNSSVSYGLLGRQETVTPRDGNTFITDTFPIVALNLNGITQELALPMTSGKRYAFAVDVYAQPDPLMFRELVLELRWSESFGCTFGFPLAISEPITPGAWETKCFDFIAPNPVRNVMFMVNAPGDLVNFTALHFDNIRADDPVCQFNAATP
jgi:hypothetical protein